MINYLGLHVGDECEYDEECSYLDSYSYCLEVNIRYSDIKPNTFKGDERAIVAKDFKKEMIFNSQAFM